MYISYINKIMHKRMHQTMFLMVVLNLYINQNLYLGNIAKISFKRLISSRNGSTFFKVKDDELAKACYGFKGQNVILASQQEVGY